MHVITIKKFMYWECIFALYLDIQVWYKIIESKRILRLLKRWWIIDFLIFLEWQPTEPRQGNWRLIAVGYEMSVSWHTYHRATYHRLYIIWNKKSIQNLNFRSATLSPSEQRHCHQVWIWTEIAKHFESLVG